MEMKKRFKWFISRFAIVFCMTLMFGVLGNNSVHAEGIDQHTKLLMHMEDSTFKDECGHVITNNSGVTLDSITKKIGNNSACFNGTSSYLTTPSNSDLNFGDGDFTIELYVKGDVNQISPNPMLIRSNYSNVWPSDGCISLHYYATNPGQAGVGKIAFYVSNTPLGNNPMLISKSLLNDSKWHHVAITRFNGVLNLWIDGKSEATYNYTGIIDLGHNGLAIGGHSVVSDAYFKGYIDELRISGIARWISISEISLNKASMNLKVDYTDTLAAMVLHENATNKTVTWKSSDESIAKVDSTGKVTAVMEGTATITATTQDGSNLSASCIVTVKSKDTTPINPTDNTGNAILTITMTNGNIKSYTVNNVKVDDFISWYNNRANGSNGNSYYTFDKTESGQPFTKKTEYIVFDKISSFEVDEYDKK